MTAPVHARSVLVVDEDNAFRKRLVEGLHIPQFSIRIFEAKNTSEAEELLSSQHFDLVITQLKGNTVDGTRLMHQCGQSVVLVYSEMLEGYKKVNSVHFVQKPEQIAPFSDLVCSLFSAVGSKPKVDITAFEVFRKSVVQYFTRNLAVDVGVERLTLRKSDWWVGAVGVSIPLKCRVFEGQFVFLMEHPTFLAMTNHVLNAQHGQLNEENLKVLVDGVDEIFKLSKLFLNDQGFGFNEAAPRLLQGDECRFKPTEPGHICVMSEFKSIFGSFATEVQVFSWRGR